MKKPNKTLPPKFTAKKAKSTPVSADEIAKKGTGKSQQKKRNNRLAGKTF